MLGADATRPFPVQAWTPPSRMVPSGGSCGSARYIASDHVLSTELATLRRRHAIDSLQKCRQRLMEKLSETDRALERLQAVAIPCTAIGEEVAGAADSHA